MPQCPICHAAVWVGESYCATCDNYLPHAEEDDRFCPQCNIRVAPQQEICHKCKAVLPKISVPTTPSSPKVTTPTPSLPIYIVNVDGLALRDGPAMSAPQIATLNLDDEVELLETSGGWWKVRDARRNIIGWSYMRYLAPSGG
jgi:SH3 domain-containing protein